MDYNYNEAGSGSDIDLNSKSSVISTGVEFLSITDVPAISATTTVPRTSPSTTCTCDIALCASHSVSPTVRCSATVDIATSAQDSCDSSQCSKSPGVSAPNGDHFTEDRSLVCAPAMPSTSAPSSLEDLFENRHCVTKRTNYLEWNEYFIAISFLSAMRSKDPATQVGACIVDPDNRIVGIGYNGMPRGCSDDVLPWSKSSPNPLLNKYMYVCHAEMNAILNKNAATLRDCTIYTALFPCNECSKLIIQAGIRRVVFVSDKHSHKPATQASKLLLKLAGVDCVRFEPHPDRRRIVVDLDSIDASQS